MSELKHPAVDNPPKGRIGAQRRPRIGEDVSDWAEEFRAAALLIPGSWRDRAKKKLARQNISVGPSEITPGDARIARILAEYAASYAKKVEHMRIRSERRQRAIWEAKQQAKREAAVRDDVELDELVEELLAS